MNESRAFLDTNVLVYLVSADAAKACRSEALLKGGGVISVQVLNEFASVARRKHKMPWDDVRTVLDAARAAFSVVPVTIETHERGLDVAERHKLHIYDAMIVAAAALARCGVVYSEDMRDGSVIDGVTVRNPFIAL